MHNRKSSIPVIPMSNEPELGIVIDRLTVKDIRSADAATLNEFEEARKSHRHAGYSFFLLEKGQITIQIDFRKYRIKPMSLVYLHPNQVHRTKNSEKIIVSSWSIDNEHLNPDYLKWLEEITPAKPLLLKAETFRIMSEAVTLCIKLAERKKDKLYHSLLKDSCNTLVALAVSQLLEQSGPADALSRFDTVTKAFKKLLENNYRSTKRPAAYAQMLNISTAYLNECVKNTTGISVSHQIQERLVLEAKRLLYHSGKSVKEIAEVLGFDDYPYFTRLFSKVTGTTAVAFRNKNRD